MSDQSDILQKRVTDRIKNKRPIRIVAGNSKSFYAQNIQGDELDVKQHTGIISYEPTELVITARCGTPLSEIENTLAEHNQMLAFEPPRFSEHSTFGGCLSAGLSGPRRPFAGAARDFTLGVTMINGNAEVLKFGGQVMKNVAGYDVSRLMVGALGTLGLILDASVKILPIPQSEITLAFEYSAEEAIEQTNRLCAKPLPISASCYDGKRLFIRLSGTQTATALTAKNLGGETIVEGDRFWSEIKDQRHEFFNTDKPVWRLSVPPATPMLDELGKEQFIEWRGALRWLRSNEPAEKIRELVAKHNGHVTLFRNAGPDDLVFEPISGKLHELHMNLKLAMDPYCLFNPGRMYQGF